MRFSMPKQRGYVRRARQRRLEGCRVTHLTSDEVNQAEMIYVFSAEERQQLRNGTFDLFALFGSLVTREKQKHNWVKEGF